MGSKEVFIESFVCELQKQLEKDLNAIFYKSTPVKGYDIRIELVENAIRQIKKYVSDHPYPSRDVEIKFMKCWALPFIKLYIYYVKLYNLEATRITTDKDELLHYIQEEKRKIGAFFVTHQDLYRYYRTGRTDEDEKHFAFRVPFGSSDFLIADSTFCRASLVLGELLAYEEYRNVLYNEIEQVTGTNVLGKKIELKVPKAAIAEIIIPIFELEWIWIDNRPATLNELIRLTERAFNIDMKDFSVIDNANRNRKKSANPYLEQMIQASNRRRERLDP